MAYQKQVIGGKEWKSRRIHYVSQKRLIVLEAKQLITFWWKPPKYRAFHIFDNAIEISLCFPYNFRETSTCIKFHKFRATIQNDNKLVQFVHPFVTYKLIQLVQRPETINKVYTYIECATLWHFTLYISIMHNRRFKGFILSPV